MTKPELTIIMPCFNMEKYLTKSLDSIFSQTYQNFKLIVVDDSSTDNSYKILTEYQKKHQNMLVIKNEKNSGAGYSRNIALTKCNSKYVTFIDGDDYIDNNYYESFIKNIKKLDADIGICDITVFDLTMRNMV